MPILKKLSQPKFYSNLFFLFPLIYSILQNFYFMIAVLLTVTVMSSLYHYFDEKKFKIHDYISSFILIFSNLFLCYLFDFDLTYFLPAFTFMLIALYFTFTENKHNYQLNHAVWHFFSACITMACLIGYGSLF